jgi:hypothetical protein
MPTCASTISVPPLVYELDEAVAAIGVSPRWLADQLRAGKFRAHKIARRWKFSNEDLDEILRLCAVGPRPALPTNPDGPQATSMTRTTARRLHREANQGKGAVA